MVTGGVGSLRHRLAGSAGGGGAHRGPGGAAAGRRGVGDLAPGRRRGQQQGVAGTRWRHGRQRHRGVQAGAAALWGLRRAVQLGRQQAVLVLRTSDLRRDGSGWFIQTPGSLRPPKATPTWISRRVTLTNCRSVRARTQKSGMYWKGVPGIWVMLPPTEPHSGVRSVQLNDAERLRLPPCDGERNSGADKEKSR